jgi:hypothetical protein
VIQFEFFTAVGHWNKVWWLGSIKRLHALCPQNSYGIDAENNTPPCLTNKLVINFEYVRDRFANQSATWKGGRGEMRKLVSVLIVAAAVTVGSMVAQIGSAQSNKRPELFTSYVSGLPFQVDIPAETCAAIIGQADRIVNGAAGFKALNEHDLVIASFNLRSCATSKDLARTDRDLAVGLYGEVIAERERRLGRSSREG